MNNPLMYSDPDGEFWLWFAGAIVGGYLNGVAANNGNWNPGKWDWQNTWSAVLGGAIGGAAVSGTLGNITSNAGAIKSFLPGIVSGGLNSAFSGGNFLGGIIGGISYSSNLAGNSLTSTDRISAGYKYIVSPDYNNGESGLNDPGPVYTAQHYALIQGLSTFANRLFGTPFTLDKLTEYEKQSIFKQSARKTTAILMYEYASGTGPEQRIFYPGDALTEDIKWSNSSARAATRFANDYNTGKIRDGQTIQYYIGTSPDKIGISGSIDAHFKGLGDQSVWRGGMVYNMQKRGNKLYVNVVDKYTVSSGISRNDADAFNRGKTITPLGTTTITIHFNYHWINTK